MAAVLCATHGNLFAACAIHSGLMFHSATTALQAVQVMRNGSVESQDQIVEMIASRIGARQVSALIIQGTDDDTVNPLNAEQIVDQMRQLAVRLHPQGSPPTLSEEHWTLNGGRRYRQQDLSRSGTLLLRSILIEGLGHAWSGGDARHRFFDAAGPDASQLIMEFLLQFRLPEALIGGAGTASSPPTMSAGALSEGT